MEVPILLFCDIDGVLIPFPDADGNIPDTHHRLQVTPTGYENPVTVWLNPTHGEHLRKLVAATGLCPVWCTSWRADASSLLAPYLGLPPWPHVDLPRPNITTSHPRGYLWKRDYAAAYAADLPFAWLDDDFTPADHCWAAARTAEGRPTLLVQPDPHHGLQADHLRAISAWAQDVAIDRHTGVRGGHGGVAVDEPSGP